MCKILPKVVVLVAWLIFCAFVAEAKRHCREELRNPKRSSCVKDFYSRYHSLDEIMRSVKVLVKKTMLNVKVKNIGETSEGRTLQVIQIVHPGKPHVFIMSGLHAREHIAQATGTYLVYDYLMKNKYVKHFNVHLLTVANPDGYVHSRKKGQKFWRKNRKKLQGSKCFGIDLNRNFGFKHGLSGTSNRECSNLYGGKMPFSTQETKAVRDYVMGLRKTPILGLDLHAYKNLLLYPYGFKKGAFPDNINEIRALGERAARAIKGMVTTPAAELGEASGSTNDWMKGDACIRFVYTFELPGYGQQFWPNRMHIWPLAHQVRDSINIMFKSIRKLVANEKERGTLKKKWCDKIRPRRLKSPIRPFNFTYTAVWDNYVFPV